MMLRYWGPQRIEEAIQGSLDINLLDRRGLGALHWCIGKERSELFDRLLTAGAGPNMPSSHTLSTPLHYAMYSPNDHFVKALLRAGADPNKTDQDNRTPLFDAILENNLEAVRLLLQHGANTAIVARGKHTPYGTALLSGRIEIARLLQDLPMGTTRTPTEWLYLAVREKLWQIIPYLIERGAR